MLFLCITSEKPASAPAPKPIISYCYSYVLLSITPAGRASSTGIPMHYACYTPLITPKPWPTNAIPMHYFQYCYSYALLRPPWPTNAIPMHYFQYCYSYALLRPPWPTNAIPMPLSKSEVDSSRRTIIKK